MTKYQLYIDGASRGNPGPSGAGIFFVKKIEYHEEQILKKSIFLGQKTNNQAEYLALLFGLLYIQKYINNSDKLEIISDSELLVRQLNGIYAVKNPILKEIYIYAKELLKNFDYKVIHVLREKNTIADQLANIAIDKKSAVPAELKSIWQKYENFS